MHHFGRLPIMMLVVVGFMAFRMFRMTQMQRGGRGRHLRLDQLWIVPALLAVATAFVLSRGHMNGMTLIAIFLGLLAGAAVGWWRGGLMRISVDRATGRLIQQPSPAAMIFLVGLFVARFALRAFVFGTAARYAATAIDGLMVFTLAMFSVQRLEMYLRGRRLLAGRIA